MRQVFADTAYWVALVNRQDGLHESAVDFCSELSSSRIVTSEVVLVEVLNYFSGMSSELRLAASALVHRLDVSSWHRVIPQTSRQFREAVRLYERRPDKEWSLTDCASILIMQAEGIDEVLSHDIHFVQAGFKALLRRATS